MRKKIVILRIAIAAVLLIPALQMEVFGRDKALDERLSDITQEMILDGKYEEAIKKLFMILEYYPDNAHVYLTLGIAHYGLMKYEDAYRHLKESEAIGLKGEIKDMLDYAVSVMDQNLATLKEIEGAANSLKDAGESEKEIIKEMVASGHIRLLGKLLEQRYYPAMVTAHAAWLKDNAEYFPQIHKISGDIYYSIMRYNKAVEDYKHAVEKDPGNGELHRTLADCLVAMGDFDQAQEYYDKSIELYRSEGLPKNDPRILRLQKVKKALPKKYKDISELMKHKRYEEAEAICRRRISLNPGDYVAISQLGEVYWQRNDKKMAEKLFKKVVRRVPDYPVARFLLGKAYFFRRKYKAAGTEFEIFKEKMELLPKMDEDTVDFYVSVLHNIGYMYSTIKRYDIMLKEGQKALQLKPEDQITHYNLAVCYYNHNRKVSLAYKELQKVIEIDDSTELARRAAFFIDYIRRNPDPRFIPDFSFILEE